MSATAVDKNLNDDHVYHPTKGWLERSSVDPRTLRASVKTKEGEHAWPFYPLGGNVSALPATDGSIVGYRDSARDRWAIWSDDGTWIKATRTEVMRLARLAGFTPREAEAWMVAQPKRRPSRGRPPEGLESFPVSLGPVEVDILAEAAQRLGIPATTTFRRAVDELMASDEPWRPPLTEFFAPLGESVQKVLRLTEEQLSFIRDVASDARYENELAGVKISTAAVARAIVRLAVESL